MHLLFKNYKFNRKIIESVTSNLLQDRCLDRRCSDAKFIAEDLAKVFGFHVSICTAIVLWRECSNNAFATWLSCDDRPDRDPITNVRTVMCQMFMWSEFTKDEMVFPLCHQGIKIEREGELLSLINSDLARKLWRYHEELPEFYGSSDLEKYVLWNDWTRNDKNETHDSSEHLLSMRNAILCYYGYYDEIDKECVLRSMDVVSGYPEKTIEEYRAMLEPPKIPPFEITHKLIEYVTVAALNGGEPLYDYKMDETNELKESLSKALGFQVSAATCVFLWERFSAHLDAGWMSGTGTPNSIHEFEDFKIYPLDPKGEEVKNELELLGWYISKIDHHELCYYYVDFPEYHGATQLEKALLYYYVNLNQFSFTEETIERSMASSFDYHIKSFFNMLEPDLTQDDIDSIVKEIQSINEFGYIKES